MPDWLLALDGGALLWIQEHLRTPFLDGAVSFYSTLGNAGVLFLTAALVLICFRRTRRAGAVALLAIAVGFVCTNVILKNLIARPRPWLDVAGLTYLVTENDPNSFPSGHTCAAFAFAVGVRRAAPKRWMGRAALVLAVLMGLSRLYVGVHYPSDVLAGALVGALSAWIAAAIAKGIAARLRRRREPE